MNQPLCENIIQILTGDFPDNLPSVIVSQIFENQPFENVLSQCKDLVHTYCCRHVWGSETKAFLYRCKTCALSPDSCICVDCFNAGDHTGHDWYMLKSGCGGTCDCGRKSAWKESGFCKNHGKEFKGDINEITPEPWKETFEKNMETLLALMMEKLLCIIEVIEKEGSVRQVDQFGIATIFKIIKKCCEIDLFHFHVASLMTKMKGPYCKRLTRKNPCRVIGIDEFLIDVSLTPCDGFVDEVSTFVMGLLVDESVTERLYPYFMDAVTDVVGNDRITTCHVETLNKLMCQFTSCTELNLKYFFHDHSRHLNYLVILQRFFENDAANLNPEDPKIKVINLYVSELSSMLSPYPYLLYDIPTLFDQYLLCLNSLMFFHSEKRELYQHVRYENLSDLSCYYCKEVLVSIGKSCFSTLSVEKLLKVIPDIRRRYLLNINDIVDFKSKNVPNVGITHEISVFYPLLSLLISAISFLPLHNQLKEVSGIQQLVTYPLMFQQFLAELTYNQLWSRNGNSALMKSICCLPEYPYQQMYDYYLFQLAAQHPTDFFYDITKICKIPTSIQLPTFNLSQNFSPKKNSIQISPELSSNFQELPNESIAGSIAILRIVINVFADPIISNNLSITEHIKYVLIHALAGGINTINAITNALPESFYDQDVRTILGSIATVHQAKCSLNESEWIYVNPVHPYYSDAHREIASEQYFKRASKTLPKVFHYENRPNEVKQRLLIFLHRIEISKFCVSILQRTKEVKVISLVEQLLRLRVAYPGPTYDNEHNKILESLGIALAAVKDWRNDSAVKWCKGSQLDAVAKGYVSVHGEEKKAQNIRKKRDALMKSMKSRQSKFISGADDENEELDENVVPCVICMASKNSVNDPLGFLGHIEATDAINSAEYYETHESSRGETGGVWKMPSGMKNGEWDWHKNRFNRWSVIMDDIDYRVVTACPHIIHFSCYMKHYEDSGNEENYYLNKNVFCPVCKALSNVFIPLNFDSCIEKQFGDNEKEIEDSETIQTPTSIVVKDDVDNKNNKEFQMNYRDIDMNNLHWIWNLQPSLQSTINGIIKTLIPTSDPLPKSLNVTILRTLSSTIRCEINRNPLEYAFLSLTNVISTTVMTLELRLRSNVPTRYATDIQVLHSLLTVTHQLSKRLPHAYIELILSQLHSFSSPHSPLLLLIRSISLSPTSIPLYLRCCHMHHLLSVYSELHNHSNFNPPIPNSSTNESPNKVLLHYGNTLKEATICLSQTYLRRIHILIQAIQCKPTPLQESYDLPINEIEKDLLTYEKIRCQGYIQRPTLPLPFKFIALPHTYQQLITDVLKSRCAVCGIEARKIIYNCAICMTCGCLLCYKDSKKKDDAIHSDKPIFEHITKCSGEVGVVLVVHTASLVIITPKMHALVNGVYVDKFGEEPGSIIMSKDMHYLNTDLIDKITDFYLTGETSSSPELNFCVPKFH
ncbi:E3 ubiquitin-protein ligase [Entamoeba marina]